ncbi:unnamed protein product [Spirodela intermedia]|uniref:Uncharacterized protein n=1 Tax=Spirodela intermedia TaxID=51605 RepID=A0A7I8JB40_SPIIN|nr:unnamed protein product [Spirodela intermedia]CAA6666692.1 unnamed protein product [Spirodela intermedia]
MEGESAAKEHEVAGILIKLRRFIWEADRGTPCTHSLRWGARRRRSAGGDDPHASRQASSPPAAPPPPSRPPEPLSKRRRRDALKARAAGDSESPAKPPPVCVPPPAASNRKQPPAAAPETSSPETPLDFCPSGEEQPDAKAKTRPSAAAGGAPRLKKPRIKHGELLSNQVEVSNRTRRELEKEAAEVRNRLEVLKERNSMLKELRLKLEKETSQQRQRSPEQEHRESCSDLLPPAPVLSAAAAAAPPPPQVYQQPWPQHWVNNHVVLHRSSAGGHHWSWMASPMWKLDGDKDASPASNLPDLNSVADKDSGEEFPPQHPQGNYHHHHHQQHQEHHQQGQRRGSLEEQRAARKKRIEMIHTRRRIAAMR